MGQCTNLILHCLDYRIQETINAWINQQSLTGDIDIVSIAGSCKNKDIALDNITLGIKLHDVRRIFLTRHDDCRAYGGHEEFESLEMERAALTADMTDLKNRIRQQHPQVEVTSLYIERRGDSRVIVTV